jgi:hypothetical protein
VARTSVVNGKVLVSVTLCSNLDNVVVGTGGHGQVSCPIMPDASTVAKRDVPHLYRAAGPLSS